MFGAAADDTHAAAAVSTAAKMDGDDASGRGAADHKSGRTDRRKRHVGGRENRVRTRPRESREQDILLSLLRVALRCRPHSSKSLEEPVQWFGVTESGKSHRCQFLTALKFPAIGPGWA